MSDQARLLGVRPIAFADNLGSEAMIEAPKWAQRLFLARVTAALRAASRRLRVVAALRPAARRFRVIAAFWPGVSVTLGLAFMVSPFSQWREVSCQADRAWLRPHRATGDSTKHAIYRLATVCDNWAAPLHLLSTCLGSGSACAR
jgi:hypothetical protein